MARTELDHLVVKVSADLKQFEQGMDTATKRVQVFDKTAGAATSGATRFTASTANMGKTAKQASGGMGELRESFASLVSQMAGVHPVSGKLLSVFGSLAVGSGVMIGVLGGLAALGAAFKFLTRDITAAKEASEKAFATLDKLAEKARSMGGIAELNTAIIEAEERLKKIRPLLAALRAQRELGGGTDPSSAERRLADEFAELTFKIGEANKRIKEIEAEKIKANNDAYAKTIRAEAAAHTEAAAAVKEYQASLADTVAELRTFLGLQKRISLVLPSAGTVRASGLPGSDASGAQARDFVFGEAAQETEKLAESTGILGNAFNELTSRISAMLPGGVSSAIANPLSLFSNVPSMIIGGIFDAFSRRSSAARRVRELEAELAMHEMGVAARRAGEALNNFATSMRNVPLTFSTAFAGYRVGSSRETAVPFDRPMVNGGVTIQGGVTIYASNWEDIERGMYDAANRGNPLARSLVRR